MNESSKFIVRAVRARQGEYDVYALFMPGSRLLRIADISRLSHGDDGKIAGFQRPRIRDQVRAIAEYLSQGPVLFPNAIVLALAPDVRFAATRGPRGGGRDERSEAGTLTIPVHASRASAWIVDGQQRTLALAETASDDLLVPVIAFVSEAVSVQREQFILVNKARPLSRRLIDELLPEVDFPLPRDLSVRKIPSYLCNVLNEFPDSPFRGLIRRPSSMVPGAVVTDSSIVRIIEHSIQDPRGALAAHVAPDGSPHLPQMLSVLMTFWTAVREVFGDAWGLPPDRSRLMHSTGIEAMGFLMDQIMTRVPTPRDSSQVRVSLEKIAADCHWIGGRWDVIDREWNDIQSTRRDVKILANHLVWLDRQSRAGES